MTHSSRGNRSENGVLSVITFSHLAQHFHIGLSILYPAMMLDLNLNYTQLGVVTGVSSTVSGFLQMVWSVLNRYSSRRVLLGTGNILISLGCFLTGAATRFTGLLAASVTSGFGQAAQHPIGTSIITRKFSREKVSGALSIHYGLGYAGNMISPIILSSIAVVFGWRFATYVLGIVPLVAGLILLYYLRGEESASRLVLKKDASHVWKDVGSAIRMRGVLLIIAVQAFAGSGTGQDVVTTYAPLFLKNQLGVGIVETSVIYSAAVVGGIVGTILFGHLADRFGSLAMASAILGSGFILILSLTLHTSFNMLIIPHLFIIGIVSFSFPSLLQAHLASISTPEQRDMLLGLYFTISFGISALWTTLTGYLIDVYGSFNPAWFLRAGLGAIAFLISLVALRRHSPDQP